MLNRVGAAAAELEAVAGTAETIDANDVLLAEDWKVGIDPDMLDMNVVRTVPDKKSPIRGGVKSPVSGSVLIRGSGTKGTAPGPLGDILQSLGLTQTADAGYGVSWIPLTDLGSAKSITAKQFKDGKYRTAKGVRGTAKISLKAGEYGKLEYDGQGAFEAQGDAAVLAEPSALPVMPKFLSANMYLLKNHSGNIETIDGAVEELRQSTGTANEKIAVKVTIAATFKPVFVLLPLAVQGTPAGANADVRAVIYSDNAGAPDAAVTNGATAYKDCSDISTTQKWCAFKFSTPPTLTAADYWLVLEGRFTQSDTDNVTVDTMVVAAGGQLTQVYSASAWGALALKNMAYILVGEATPDLVFDGAEIDLGLEVALQKDPNDDNGYIAAELTGREIKVSLAPLEKLAATRDFWTYLDSETDLFFRATLGTADGNNFTFQCLHAKCVKAGEWGERDGMVTAPIEVQVDDGPANFALYQDAP